MRILLTAILVIATHLSFAQSKEGQKKEKSHFYIHNCTDRQVEIYIYEAADLFSDFDRYRYIDARRIIQIDGTNMTLELRSGKELLEEYGKEIHIYNQFKPKHETPVILTFDYSKVPVFIVKSN